MDIYIENARHNSYARGGWINLPILEDELSRKLNLYYGETIITDYALPFTITEHENPHKINEVLKELLKTNLTYTELKILFKISDSDWKDTAEKIINGEYQLLKVDKANEFKIVDETDVARYLYDNDQILFLFEVPTNLYDYLDWNKVWDTCNMSENWIMFVDAESLTTYAVKI